MGGNPNPNPNPIPSPNPNPKTPTLTLPLTLTLLGSFASEQDQPSGWNEIVRYGAPPNISVANDTMVIAWPAGHFDDYAPRTPETVRLTLPGSAVASGAPLSLGSFVVTVDAGSATLSGSLAATPTEAALRSAEPQTLRLTLEGDTWAPTVGLEGDVTNALLSSLSSAQSEAAAWLEVVKPGLSSTDLERLDAHTLVLTVPQRAAYDIAAPETISWSVPAEATFGLHRYEPEAIELLPTAGSAKMLGSMMVRNTDAQLQNDEEISLVVRLTGDSWVAAVDHGGEVTRELLAGLASAQSEAYGWNAVVRPFLGQRAGSLNITLQSTTELTIGLPSISLYDISVTESISLTIPPSALVSQVRANPNPKPNPNPNPNPNPDPDPNPDPNLADELPARRALRRLPRAADRHALRRADARAHRVRAAVDEVLHAAGV